MTDHRFAPRSPDDLRRLVLDHPFAWVVSAGEDRTQAPTWNHASAQFVVDIGLTEEAAELEALLRDLIDAMEADRPNAWRLEDMGPRYERLSRGVIGFRARVQERRSRFKLGQDERPDVFREILQGLSRDGHAELRAWMEAFEATDH
jgi:predicted FMN-binding regulatory protein PaiB